MMSRLKNELLVECLPKDLPEYLELDVSALHLNESLHLSDLKLPEGVLSVELQSGKNPSIVAVHAMRAEEVEVPVAAAAEGAAVAAPAAGAAPAAAATAGDDKKPAAAAAKKEEPKKDAKK
jgi:large subunit ribosomal protein L25